MPQPLWTQADIDTLKDSIRSGLLSVSYAGPPQRSVTYQSLAEMRKLLAEMNSAVNGAEQPTHFLATFDKGF